MVLLQKLLTLLVMQKIRSKVHYSCSTFACCALHVM